MRFRQSAAWPENRSWDRSWGQNSFAGLPNYFAARKIKKFPVYLNMVCGKQVCLRNKKKKTRTHDLQISNIKLWDWRAAYCANEAFTILNIYLNIFNFFHDSTKPKNYISLLIRVPRCFYPKENTRQTLRHILALAIYVYTWGRAGSWWQK